MAIKTRTKHMLAGGALGALGLALVYELFQHRRDILRPLPPPGALHERHEEHERHGRREHEHQRGESARGEHGREREHGG